MSQTATITPTVPVRELWEATAPVTGDYARDCAELAREALSHVGFSHFEETPFEDVLACREGDLPVTVAVLPVPVEGFEIASTSTPGACVSTTCAGRGSRSHGRTHRASGALATKAGAFLLCDVCAGQAP